MIKGIDYTGITVAAFVVDLQKGLLCGYRTDQCRDEHWTRDNRGGGLKHNETLHNGIRRELKEEFDVDVHDHQIHAIGYREQFRTHEGKPTHWLGFYHIVLLDDTQTIINMEPHKHSKLEYFPFDALPPKGQSHSLFYPNLLHFQADLERITGQNFVIV